MEYGGGLIYNIEEQEDDLVISIVHPLSTLMRLCQTWGSTQAVHVEREVNLEGAF